MKPLFVGPLTIRNHRGVESIVLGEDQGSDSKYWVFLHDGWGYDDGTGWICGGTPVESVADFRSLKLEYRRPV